ncbi:MAG: hypothetical protein P4L83_05140 [Nevskia sp.]|nr:hypothetical protein [Nevskia sp.]
MRKSTWLPALAVLALAACSSNGGSGVSGPGGGGSSGAGSTPEALSSFVQSLLATPVANAETALPVDLTTMTLDTSSEDPAAYASLFLPGS